ncbi:Uncharacterized protein TCM_036806 [Theobroma cacao]|uniref:Uncharacterized protein n=1 Tax=Theobroma cacao TaxID=3641 RepID=A0A061GH89_THECC|nr:Uncharacterized protein TCM_036806 [Theobroma cacao]
MGHHVKQIATLHPKPRIGATCSNKTCHFTKIFALHVGLLSLSLQGLSMLFSVAFQIPRYLPPHSLITLPKTFACRSKKPGNRH